MKKMNNVKTNRLYNKEYTLRMLNATYIKYDEYIKSEEVKYNKFVKTLKEYKDVVVSKRKSKNSIQIYLENVKKIIKNKEQDKLKLEKEIILFKENIDTTSNLKIVIIKNDITKIVKEINYYLEKEKDLIIKIEKISREIEYSRQELSKKLIDFEVINAKRKNIIKKQENNYMKIQQLSKEISNLKQVI